MNFDVFYETSGVCTDTRNIQKDCLFICLKGVNFNGNLFALQALEQGAKYVIVDEDLEDTSESIIRVEDSLKYLQLLANYHRSKFAVPVIGITGSNGKTTSKELISSVLAKKYKVLFTEGNLNNHIGVPLTLLRLTADHEIAVIEMGANKLFDIQELCDIALPTHGIITNIGKAHLGGFINFEGVLKTKTELYESISKQKGVLFVNGDDSILMNALPQDIEVVSFSKSNQASAVNGEILDLNPFVLMKWGDSNFKSEAIQTQMIGAYNFYNFLAAITIGRFFNVDAELISDAIAQYTPSNNRSQVFKSERNTLILDAYNANPTSMKAALESFAAMQHPDKLAILGDMFELGDETPKEHELIQTLAIELKISCIFVGTHFSTSKLEHDLFLFFSTIQDAKAYLDAEMLETKLILLKGSRGIGLEQLVSAL